MKTENKKALEGDLLRLESNVNQKSLAATYSSTLLCAVPSAMKGLTSEFGMGSGISLSLMPPSKNLLRRAKQLHLQKTALEDLLQDLNT